MKVSAVSSDNPKPLAVYTEAFCVGDLVFAAGQLATDFKGGIPDKARRHPAFPFYGSDIKLQTDYILKTLATTFEAAGSGLDHIVKAQVFLTDLADFAGFDEVWKTYFKTPPARTTVQTTDLLIKDALIEIDLIGYVPRPGLDVTVIKSGLPAPIAHYTEAFRVGNMVFAAGQLATDFKTGIPASARKHPAFPFYGSDIKLQTDYILKNLATTFAAAGTSLDHVVKAQVFLTDLNDFAAFDEVWKTYFKVPPARTTVGTSGLLIKDALIEIDLIGHVPVDGVGSAVSVSDAPRPLAHYSEAHSVGDLIFAAGQFASDFTTGVPSEARRDPAFPFYGSDIKLQTHYTLKNLAKTFAAAGSSLDDVVKAQVFLTDLADFNGFDEVWKQYFKTPPARTTVGTTGLLVKDTLVEIDLIAAKRS
ncbi:RidA family protein [Beijerinckia sp. L45]|uniref:RidA family protein n=1 Tax=Beijerinckia sp. L45 TaxID=1641855 RepID=UPI00131B73BD|nr:RidA family protein [Beijerinckia sp. L45]